MSLSSWLWGDEPRRTKRAPRQPIPGLIAYYWDGGTPVARRLKDISSTGAFLLTPDTWYPGTIIKLTLQSEPEAGDATAPDAVSITCKVTRRGRDGLGVRFVFPTDADKQKVARFVLSIRERMLPGGEKSGENRGQALIEFALMLPVLFVLIFNAVNFGCFLYAFITVSDAARAGVQYASLGVVSAFAPPVASVASVTSVVQTATSYLPNSGSVTVAVCQNNNGTVTQLRSTAACPAGSATPTADSEPITGSIDFSNVTVDVTYQYVPLISLPNIVGWPLTIPPTTIRKSATMRMLN